MMYRFIVHFFFAVILFSCSDKKSPEENNSSATEEKRVPESSESKFSVSEEHEPMVKETLFLYFRERVVRVDQNTFVKYEALELNNDGFVYEAVVIDRAILIPLSSEKLPDANILFASLKQLPENDLLGDTIRISGTFAVIASQSLNPEGKLASITINMSSLVETSFLQQSPYDYGETIRTNDGYEIEEELIVKLDQPTIYSRDDLYLKARIHELTINDLEEFSKEELTQIRNEIFARHGHTFKTQVMREYFTGESWYSPYFEDATPFLNETERKNALFIKSLES